MKHDALRQAGPSLNGRQIFVYRWGTNPRMWRPRRVTPAQALESLQELSGRLSSVRLEAGDPRSARTPANADKMRAGDVVLFYAGQKFRPVGVAGVYGIALAGTAKEERAGKLAVSSRDWKFRVRWLPASRQLAVSPFQGRDDEFAPSGPSSTLLQLPNPSGAVIELARRSLAGTLIDGKSSNGLGKAEPKSRGGARGRPAARPPADLEVAERAVTSVTEYFQSAKWRVIPVSDEGRGWDLEARRGDRLLRIEVKGTSSDSVSAELTPNEYRKMRQHRSSYRLCIVLNALADYPRVVDFRWTSGAWVDGSGRHLTISPRVGAAVRLQRG